LNNNKGNIYFKKEKSILIFIYIRVIEG